MNQRGITLVELVAALALVSIIAVAAWTTLTIGINHGAAETSKTMLQQDANIIISKLSAAHRLNDYYYLQFVGGNLEIKTCNDTETPGVMDCGTFNRLSDNSYVYSGSINGTGFATWNSATIIEPKKKHVNFILNVTDDPIKTARAVEVKTTLTRIITH
ncbi:prepilin-type N-terminal cleavage/methylation domain-containing protein [Planococcus salinarum]|uniref:prepilin-type N-terminal cleavage/methylation domain-containing protein n=1 Tax=Planococcus salinarum TaxID=622695 RepID=UPI00163DD71F|nr:prepilin-type N-terminal cleavage/methylation domain-containing protein [Planococcus salinarum]